MEDSREVFEGIEVAVAARSVILSRNLPVELKKKQVLVFSSFIICHSLCFHKLYLDLAVEYVSNWALHYSRQKMQGFGLWAKAES